VKTPLAEELGLEVPVFAFSKAPEVVAAVSRAGAILSEHVPPRGDDRNELPDGLTILPKR